MTTSGRCRVLAAGAEGAACVVASVPLPRAHSAEVLVNTCGPVIGALSRSGGPICSCTVLHRLSKVRRQNPPAIWIAQRPRYKSTRSTSASNLSLLEGAAVWLSWRTQILTATSQGEHWKAQKVEALERLVYQISRATQSIERSLRLKITQVS